MEDLLILLAINLLFFWLGYRIGIRTAVMRMLNKILDDPSELQSAIAQLKQAMDDVEHEEKNTQEIAVRAEWHGGHCYLFRIDTDQFLAQGADLDQAIANVKSPGDYRVTADSAKQPLDVKP